MIRQCEAEGNFTKNGKRCTNEAEISIRYEKMTDNGKSGYSHKEYTCFVCNEHREVVLQTIDVLSDLFLLGCLPLPEAREKVMIT